MEQDVVENFFGVYLLKSLNPKYKGRIYIGFTVDPNRRIKQHNRGKEHGGAWKTSQRGPWEMILTVHGFPSEVSALRFEWAWQHPRKSRRLKSVITSKKSSESSLEYNIRVMFTMLSTPPWNRLPLTIRWLSTDLIIDAPPNLAPPAHMPVTFGSVISKQIKDAKNKLEDGKINFRNSLPHCQICGGVVVEGHLLTCLNTDCKGIWHMFCLADKFLEEEISSPGPTSCKMVEKEKCILPVEGSCPQCEGVMLWGDLIRQTNGCYNSEKEFGSCYPRDSNQITVMQLDA